MSIKQLGVVNFNPSNDHLVRRGDKGVLVTEVQELLKNHRYAINVDGDFGPATERVVRQYQKDKGLVADGIIGPKTLLALRSVPVDVKLLTQKDIEWAAVQLRVKVAAIMAVNEVESRGSGFFNNGKAAILYERHIMRRRMIHHKRDPVPYIQSQPNIVNTATGGYIGGVKEYDRLDRAIAIHRTSALESASWGAYQIMGFHWKILGFSSIEEFVTRMQRSERDHLEAFVRFIRADNRLLRALRELDWATFARLFNGPGYANHAVPYDVRLASAFNRHDAALLAA